MTSSKSVYEFTVVFEERMEYRLNAYETWGLWIPLLDYRVATPHLYQMNEQQRSRIETIDMYDSMRQPSQAHELVGSFEGTSCLEEAGDSDLPSKDEAMHALRLRAAERYADAVIGVACEAAAMSYCRDSIICTGDAVKWSGGSQ